MYGGHFDIPAPKEVILVSWFEGGKVFRWSGCTYQREKETYFISVLTMKLTYLS